MTNFSEEVLILGLDVSIKLKNGEIVTLKLPTLKDMYGSITYDIFLSIMNINLEEVEKHASSVEFVASTLQGVLSGIKLKGHNLSEMEEWLGKLLPQLTLQNQGVCLNNYVLAEEELQLIKNMILVASGVIDWQEYNLRKSRLFETEADRLIREQDERVAKIKKKREERKGVKKEITTSTTSFKDAFIVILAAIPGMDLQKLYEMNMYSFQWLHIKAQELVYDRVAVVAAGNGYLKSGYKFITEK